MGSISWIEMKVDIFKGIIIYCLNTKISNNKKYANHVKLTTKARFSNEFNASGNRKLQEAEENKV